MKIKDLKTTVEQVYGIPIKYGNQCQQLSLSIFEQTGDYISFQTLRRFFGFIDKNKKPTNRTLDILSKFCGHRHYDDFCLHNDTQHDSIDSFITSIYKIPLRREEDLNYHNVCRNIAKLMNDDLSLVDKNISFLSTSIVAQEYFFERFPLIDHLNNPTYRRALLAYCSSKNTIDAFVFIQSILFLADYLKTGKAGKIPPKIELSKLHLLHPFLQARIIGTYLIGSKLDKKELVNLAFDYDKKQKDNELANYQFPFFHYMMADYFIICKMYKEALKIIELGNYNYNTQPTGWLETGYYETFDLMYCICLEATGEKTLAEKVFKEINQDHFHFIFKKYFTIRYQKEKVLGI